MCYLPCRIFNQNLCVLTCHNCLFILTLLFIVFNLPTVILLVCFKCDVTCIYLLFLYVSLWCLLCLTK